MVVFLFLHHQKGLFLFCKTGIIENKMVGDAVFVFIFKALILNPEFLLDFLPAPH